MCGQKDNEEARTIRPASRVEVLFCMFMSLVYSNVQLISWNANTMANCGEWKQWSFPTGSLIGTNWACQVNRTSWWPHPGVQLPKAKQNTPLLKSHKSHCVYVLLTANTVLRLLIGGDFHDGLPYHQVHDLKAFRPVYSSVDGYHQSSKLFLLAKVQRALVSHPEKWPAHWTTLEIKWFPLKRWKAFVTEEKYLSIEG